MIDSKIVNQESLVQKISDWKKSNLRIVFTNGCFDLLHKGHVDYLAKAADLGDVLVVGLNSDASVSRLKGKNRPIQNQDSRAAIMASLECVSAVCIFNEETPENLIQKAKPDVLVKGGDYTIETIVGADFVLSRGGMVETIPFLEGFSTSAIETKILHSKK
ncbi:MAG: D-glycero-beta-D-manno-heptose 1-phosphate adenylyltransferase [Bacteroidia bacterium]